MATTRGVRDDPHARPVADGEVTAALPTLPDAEATAQLPIVAPRVTGEPGRPRWLVIGILVTISMATIVVPLLASRWAAGGSPAVAGKAPGPGGKIRPGASPAIYPDPGRIPQFAPAPRPDRVALPKPNGSPITVLNGIPTSNRVAFITIDDGYVRTPSALAILESTRTPITMFLTTNAISRDRDYFRKLQGFGGVVESHAVTHRPVAGLSAADQREQICGSADLLERWYGRRPTLFRPPYGQLDNTTLTVARECRMNAVLQWTVSIDSGVLRSGQHPWDPANRLQPGDILLLHFRDDLAADLRRAFQLIHDSGLTPALLEDYLPADG